MAEQLNAFHWRAIPCQVNWGREQQAKDNGNNAKPKPAAWSAGRPVETMRRRRENAPPGKSTPVTAFKDGEYVMAYESLQQAADHLGLGRESVRARVAGLFTKPRRDGYGFLAGFYSAEDVVRLGLKPL